jgi:hypothetical protein
MAYANADKLAFFLQDHSKSYGRGEKIDKMRHAAGQIFLKLIPLSERLQSGF